MIFRLLALCWLTASFSHASTAVPPVPREMRAAWMATVFNIDWPSKAGLTQDEQKAELRGQLDFAAQLGLNTLIFQVRSCCDAVYESKLDPWSAFLTGTSGLSPGYDPLTYALEQAHHRGLELHAWFNPFRAKSSTKPVAANHVTKTHPEWIMDYAPHIWLDPGIPAVREYTMKVVQDLVARYDLDGIHIDDYFYPYPKRNPDKSAIPFPDDATYAKYGAGKERLAWRRENIDAFVENFYRTVKKQKPHVKVGISPFGIWQPGTPAGISGILNAYTELAADARLWIRQGWADYFAPQLYWRIDPPEQSFPVLLKWWQAENLTNRPLCPGIASARIDSTDDKGRPASEITRQIDLCRSHQVQGHAHWNLKALRTNRGGIIELLKAGPYAASLALPPACPWVDATQPSAVAAKIHQKQITISPNPNARWLSVQTQAADGSWRLRQILRSGTQPLQVTASGPTALRWISPTGIEGAAALF